MPCRNGVCTPNRAPQQQRNTMPPKQAQVPTQTTQQQSRQQQQGKEKPSWWDSVKTFFKDTFYGKDAKIENIPKFDEQFETFLNGLSEQGLGGINESQQNIQGALGENKGYQKGNLERLGDIRSLMGENQKNFGIQPIEEKARRDWANETIPTIANRFLAGNTRNSSGFQNALGSAGIDLEAALAGLRNQYGQQQQGNLINEQGQFLNQQGNLLQNQGGLLSQQASPWAQMLDIGAQPKNETRYSPATSGIVGNMIPGLVNMGMNYATGGLWGNGTGNGTGNSNNKNEEPITIKNQGRSSNGPMYSGSSPISSQAPNLFEMNQNPIQPSQLQATQQQQNQPGQYFQPQSQLNYLQDVVAGKLGTPDWQFKNRNVASNQILKGRGY